MAKIAVHLNLNGVATDILVEPRETLLEVLRDELQLFGTKEGCGNGNCGACTVLVNGRPVNSCIMLAVEAEGASIITVEGLSKPGQLHVIQQAFIDEVGFQCGFCTPGFLLNTKALLDQHPDPTEEQIRHRLAGNLCRCTGYDKIIKAVRRASAALREEEVHA